MGNSFSLIGYLGLDTKPFDRGLAQSQTKADLFSKHVGHGGGIGDALGGLGGKLSGALSVAALAEGFKKAAEWAHELKHAAEEVGMEASSFNDLTNTIGRLSRAGEGDVTKSLTAVSVLREKVLEGGDEGAKAADKFKKLGVSLDTVKSGNFEAMFSEISKNIRENGADSVTTLATMREVFGKMGPKLIPAFSENFDDELDKTKQSIKHFNDQEINDLAVASKNIEGAWKSITSFMKHGAAGVAGFFNGWDGFYTSVARFTSVYGEQGLTSILIGKNGVLGREVELLTGKRKGLYELLTGMDSQEVTDNADAAFDKEQKFKKIKAERATREAEEHQKELTRAKEIVDSLEKQIALIEKKKAASKNAHPEFEAQLKDLRYDFGRATQNLNAVDSFEDIEKRKQDAKKKGEKEAEESAMRIFKLEEENQDKRAKLKDEDATAQERYAKAQRELLALSKKLFMDREDQLKGQGQILDKTKEARALEKAAIEEQTKEYNEQAFQHISKAIGGSGAASGIFATMGAYMASQSGNDFNAQQVKWLKTIANNTERLASANDTGPGDQNSF